MGGRYLLKFISGKYQGGEFPIEPNEEIRIGRSSDLEMVLVEDMISRRHAMFSNINGEIWIEDIGSVNGTFVNGEKIQKQKLKEGDRILIGTSIIKLIVIDSEDAAPQPIKSAEPANEAPKRTQPPKNAVSSVMTGFLEDIPLPDLLQLFATSKKSGCLIINTESHEGKIYLGGGRLIGATINDDTTLPMDKGFYRMMSWNSGTFMLDTYMEAKFENPINENIEAMMMEGMRLLDEIGNLGGDLPRMADHLLLPFPLIPSLRDLTPELLDTLQIVHNFSHVETILNQSMASDLETLQDIMYLIKHEYLIVQT